MISIIVPFNNGKKYLKECLENLSKIKYKDFEVILIDDFSEDNCEEFSKIYLKTLNIKYYYTSERTVGVGNARNLGIQKSNGEYIMFLDVDDTIDENLLENLKEYIEKDIEMIKYKMKIISNNNEILVNGPVFDIINGPEAFDKLCFIDKFLDSPCLYLIKKELFERTNLKFERNVYHEDFGLIPQLIVNAKSVISSKYHGYNYFQTNNSIMRNNNYEKELKKVNDKFYLYMKLMKNLEFFDLKKQTKQNLLEYYTNSIIMSLRDLKNEDRKKLEKKIKEIGLINNLKSRNLKQFIKKIILKVNIEYYFLLQKNNIFKKDFV